MSVIATIIDISMCIFLVLSIIGMVALMFAIGFILYKEIQKIRGDDDE